MDIKEIRRRNINYWADSIGRSELARRMGYDDTNYINQLCKGHGSFGSNTARGIEVTLGLKTGWFDVSHPELTGAENEDPIKAELKSKIDMIGDNRLEKAMATIEAIVQESRAIEDLEEQRSLGRNIQKARVKAGMSQKKLALECGWGEDGQTRISNYERDRREPTIEDLQRICKAIGTSLTALIEGTEESENLILANRIAALEDAHQKAIEMIVESFENKQTNSPS